MKSLIETSTLPLQAWKNGRGVTTEIAIHPPGADFKKNDFLWRISSALITGDTAFSHFAGYNRLLFLLSGHGLILNKTKTLITGETYRFLGEDSIDCSVVKGHVLDLGIIFDRHRYRSEMDLVAIEKPTEMKFERGTYFLKGLTCGLRIENWVVPATDLLRIDAPDSGLVHAEKYPAKILKISIREATS